MNLHRTPKPLDRTKYAPVHADDLEKEPVDARSADSDISLPVERSNEQSRWTPYLVISCILPWTLTAGFAILSAIFYLDLHKTSRLGTYETDFETDFPFRTQIPLEKVRFRGSPHFYNNGSPWMAPTDEAAPWPENVSYIGEPTPELDALIGRRYFSITEEEARRAWGDKRHEYIDQNVGGYTAGLDMFHTLHCINELRKALDPDYYPSKVHTLHGARHNDHCIEILRQTVTCYGSTTLIPTKFIEGLQHNYIDSYQEHVCRSFNIIRDYTNSRMRGRGGYVPRDQSILDERKHAIAKAWGKKEGNSQVGGTA